MHGHREQWAASLPACRPWVFVGSCDAQLCFSFMYYFLDDSRVLTLIYSTQPNSLNPLHSTAPAQRSNAFCRVNQTPSSANELGACTSLCTYRYVRACVLRSFVLLVRVRPERAQHADHARRATTTEPKRRYYNITLLEKFNNCARHARTQTTDITDPPSPPP